MIVLKVVPPWKYLKNHSIREALEDGYGFEVYYWDAKTKEVRVWLVFLDEENLANTPEEIRDAVLDYLAKTGLSLNFSQSQFVTIN